MAMKVTKYKTIATSTDGKKFGGFSWRTKEGINLKQDLLYKEGNEKKRMLTELSNVKIGKQDPKLFEIPDGFTKFDMGGMMGHGCRHGPSGQPMGRPDMSGTPPPEYAQAGSRPEVVTPQETPASEQNRRPSRHGQGHQFHEGPVRPIGRRHDRPSADHCGLSVPRWRRRCLASLLAWHTQPGSPAYDPCVCPVHGRAHIRPRPARKKRHRRFPASLTKIMTALVALESAPLQEVVKVDGRALSITRRTIFDLANSFSFVIW